jgi:hypothetical protein
MGATICAVVLVAEHDSKRRRSERRNMMYRSKRSGMTVDYYELCMKLYCVVSNRIPNGSGSLCIGEAHTCTNGFEQTGLSTSTHPSELKFRPSKINRSNQ